MSLLNLFGGKPPTAEFTGEWLCTDIEGDMAKLMEGLGVGWMKRKAAGAGGYGKGKQKQTISFEGDTISIVNASGFGEPKVNTLKLDGSEQPMDTPDGETGTGTIKWEGSALVSVLVRGKLSISSKRYLRDKQMCLEVTVGDVTVTRVFTKQ